jgi:hypothetical protein
MLTHIPFPLTTAATNEVLFPSPSGSATSIFRSRSLSPDTIGSADDAEATWTADADLGAIRGLWLCIFRIFSE